MFVILLLIAALHVYEMINTANAAESFEKLSGIFARSLSFLLPSHTLLHEKLVVKAFTASGILNRERAFFFGLDNMFARTKTHQQVKMDHFLRRICLAACAR